MVDRNIGGGLGAMATAAAEEGGTADRISALPDDLLHHILAFLPYTSEAARTSVLSRRWRRVWTGLHQLSFRYANSQRPSSPSIIHAHDRVDAALAAWTAASAPTAFITRLKIFIHTPFCSRHVPAERVSSWLRFASRRLVGDLVLKLPMDYQYCRYEEEEEDIVLPPCERVTYICITDLPKTLRFPMSAGSGGAFTALTYLIISHACVDGFELGSTVSCRCPRLKKLFLLGIDLRDEVGGLSIRSPSLEKLDITYGLTGRTHWTQGRLQVAAPELRYLYLWHVRCHVHVVAPKLFQRELNNRLYCEVNEHIFL